MAWNGPMLRWSYLLHLQLSKVESRRIALEQAANPAAKLPCLFPIGGWQLACNLKKPSRSFILFGTRAGS
jgi:hypothetical protein